MRKIQSREKLGSGGGDPFAYINIDQVSCSATSAEVSWVLTGPCATIREQFDSLIVIVCFINC